MKAHACTMPGSWQAAHETLSSLWGLRFRAYLFSVLWNQLSTFCSRGTSPACFLNIHLESAWGCGCTLLPPV